MTASTNLSEDSCSDEPLIPACPRCAPLEGEGPGLGADPVRASRAWLRVGIACVIAGQTMLFGFGYSVTPESFGVSENLQPGTAAYWVLHGLLITGAVVVMALCGLPLLRESLRQLRERRLTVDMLFLLSVLGAFIGSLTSSITGGREVYYDVVSLVLAIYTLGKLLGERSREKAVAAAEGLRREFGEAVILDEEAEGGSRRVPVETVQAGARIVVAAGEPVTVDGVIEEGECFVRETALTGEPAPVSRRAGDRVLAGTWALDGRLVVKATGAQERRMLDGVIEAVAGARLRPSRLQVQADAVARWFLPVVSTVSLLTFTGWMLGGAPWTQALLYAMSVLLVACPCALGLATPMAIWGGLWTLARLGLIVRSGDFLDTLACTRRFVFDKTGTLSDGALHVREVELLDDFREKRSYLETLLSEAERDASHPVARALSAMSDSRKCRLLSSQIVAGRGVIAELEDENGQRRKLAIGEPALHAGPARERFESVGTSVDAKRVYVTVDEQPAAVVYLDELFRPGLAQTLKGLREQSVECIVLTGDKHPPEVLTKLGLAVKSGLTPEDKLQTVTTYVTAGEEPVFVGDGINDAAAMAACPGAIAMGGGAALARSTASAVLMGDSVGQLSQTVLLARNIKKTVGENLIFASVYNVIGMSLAAAGYLHPVLAALLMLFSSMIVSVRALRSSHCE